jgi:pyrrolidone-carboxylate peptidase
MLSDKVKMTGKLSIELRGPDGELKHSQEIDNLVVTVGKNFIASRMKDTTDAAMSHMAIGTGTVAADVGDTTLGAEAGRVALTSTTVTTNNVEYVATFPAGTGTGAITEAGLFNAASAGTLLCRTVFSVINKAAADSLGITWTVTVN